MAPATGPAFGSSEFLPALVEIAGVESPEAVGAWLIRNAKHMKESMFFAQGASLAELDSSTVLAMRACTPDGVFTSAAKAGFLAASAQNPPLLEIADTVFSDDFALVGSLPADLKPLLLTLIRLAYEGGVRSRDSRVENMRLR